MVGTISLDVIGCQLSRNVNYLVFVLVCLCACVHPVRIELNRNRSLSVCPLALLFRLIYLFHSWRSFIVIIMIIEANRASSQTIASVLCVCVCVVLFTWRPYRHFQWCLALTPKCGTKLNQFTFHLHSQLLYSCRLNIVSCSFFLSPSSPTTTIRFVCPTLLDRIGPLAVSDELSRYEELGVK